MDWLFGQEIQAGCIKSPFDISDVWLSSYSSNTNEIVWGAKVGTRCPWTTCVLHFSSYECGMDQPTYTPVQKIVEATGTLYFKFGDLDATKPAGGVKSGCRLLCITWRSIPTHSLPKSGHGFRRNARYKKRYEIERPI